MKFLIVILMASCLFAACEKSTVSNNTPGNSTTPLTIAFVSVKPDTVKPLDDTFADAKNISTNTIIQIAFTGQLDTIQWPDTSFGTFCYIVDSRRSPNGKFDTLYFVRPYITVNNKFNKLSGTIDIPVSQFFNRPDGNHNKWDTLQYTVAVKDIHGIYSNLVKTPDIYIKVE